MTTRRRSHSDASPPRLSEQLLRAVLSAHHRDVILGDLAQEFTERCLARPRVRGRHRWWYRVQVLRSLAPAVRARWQHHRVSRSSGRGAPGGIMLSDIRLAARGFVANPGFSLVVLLTLALGVGANAVIFAIVDAVVLRPMPFEQPAQLFRILAYDTQSGRESGRIAYADFLTYRRDARSFAGIAGFATGNGVVSGAGREPRRHDIGLVTNDFFENLGIAPLLGRTFTPNEHLGPDPVFIANHGFWIRDLGGRTDVIGETITIDAEAMTIIGVTPPGFDYPFLSDMAGWTPLAHREFDPADTTNAAAERDWNSVAPIVRLDAPDALASASVEAEGIAARLAAEFPRSNANLTVRLVPIKNIAVGRLRNPLLLLLGAVGFVFVIACVNMTNLLLARAISRRGEVGVRLALGATRTRLIRLFLTESLLLAGVGGALGLIAAHFALGAVQGRDLNAPRLADAALDVRVLAVMTVATLIAGAVCGVVPAWHASRVDVTSLQDARGAKTNRTRHRVQKVLVGLELALSTVLVVGATLLTTSFVRLTSVDPGFAPANVLTMRLNLPGARYMRDPDDAWRGSNAFFRELTEGVRRIPGIEAVALSYTNPLEPERAFNTRFQIPGFLERPRAEQPIANLRTVTPGFFETFRIPLLTGRLFDDRDIKSARGVAIVNETFVRQFFRDEDPIGYVLEGPNFWGQAGYPYPWEIVGVVGDVHSAGLGADPAPAMYFPFEQTPMGNMRLIARTSVPPQSVAPAIQREIWAIDPDLPIDNLYTMDQVIAASVAQPRLVMIFVGSFAGLALVLAIVGIYGVMSYMVGQRTAEFGLRQALGANRGTVMRLVLSQGFVVALIGVGIGLGTALAAGRAVAGLLYGVGPSDPVVLGVVGGMLLVTAVSACFLPARRATLVDPAVALRGNG